MSATDTPTSGGLTGPVAHLDDLAEGSMRMIRVDGRRLCLVRTGEGVHALDNACPHEGYGLVQGDLAGDTLTCEWHNWKFRVTDGACLVGEESVRVHDCRVADDGGVHVALREPTPEELRPTLLASLRRGIEEDYPGQIARDTVRLLHAGASPARIMWEAIEHGAPRGEYGWGHSIAMATDCLAMVDLYEGERRALPIVQGITGISEEERHRPVQPLAAPAPAHEIGLAAFRTAVEGEDVEAAQAQVLGALDAGRRPDELVDWFAAVVSDHHLSYGHGAIFSQKAFELLALLDGDPEVPAHAAHLVLGHLVPSIVYGTREDKLPYMRPFMKGLRELDLVQLATLAGGDGRDRRADVDPLVTALLGPDRGAPLDAAVAALRSGAGLDRVLDAVVLAVSERMLRYDTATEFDLLDDFNWLDITHGLTYADAVRWLYHHHRDRGGAARPEDVRSALFTVFLGWWTGRHEWHTSVAPRAATDDDRRPLAERGDALQRSSLTDGTTRPIVLAHAVKTSRAAAIEALRIGSALPLDAAARFLSGPIQERRIEGVVARSIEFVNGRIDRG